MSRRRLLGAALPLVAACALVGCGDNKTTEEGRAQLKQRVGDQLQAAKAKADAYDFDAANAILRGLPDEVDKSPFADVATYDKLKADIEAVRGAVSSQEDDCRTKTKAGWRIAAGKLVSPDDQARALAEQKRQEEAERARREAEQARLTRERGEAIKTLPAVQTALEDERYLIAEVQWVYWYLFTTAKSHGMKLETDPNMYLIEKSEVMRRIRAADARSSPVLLSYRDEILDFVENVDWATYTADAKRLSKADDVPIRFATHQNQPVLLLGALFSDTLFNNANRATNTPKKRAAAFAQKEVLPRLLKSRLTDRFKAARFGYIGLIFVYGNANAARDDDSLRSESLCLVVSTRDFAAFVNRELSQEAFVRNSAVFLASEGPGFVRVELTLE